ncbi:hypothetical protein PRIPAC_92559 [Pristionchus pacificus]|uniref:Uncharacterized protein n=1 Tax=Pristionchus pacificus TaxID=54126 RepID=A0A2A6BQ14_PRIPA|nr:hypothetical protein PRIPAC_92559 [Pristionchus pacificus]|eukprot:PDM67990.1 hypothetical protein PRIPAC_46034 [Pristionchus pacificus]
MRPDAVFDCVQGMIWTGLSLLCLLILPLAALIYCSAGKVASAGRDKAPSDKSASGTCKSKVSKPPSDTAPPPPAAAVDPNDNRTKWAATTVETSPTTVSKEFVEQLKSYAAPSRTHEAFDANIDKNRYNDIPCYDQDRIVLKTTPDYINANYMKAPDGVTYIATQTTTVLDKFTIKKIDKSEEIAPGTVRTKLEVKGKTTTRTVQHIFCDAWPDQLAPNDPATIIKIWKYVKANRAGGPVVVHCSAGVGRTATFIGRTARDMNLTPRSPQSAVFLETFRKQVDRAMEKKEKTERSNALTRVMADEEKRRRVESISFLIHN